MAEIAETEWIEHNLCYGVTCPLYNDMISTLDVTFYKRCDCEGHTCDAFFN